MIRKGLFQMRTAKFVKKYILRGITMIITLGIGSNYVSSPVSAILNLKEISGSLDTLKQKVDIKSMDVTSNQNQVVTQLNLSDVSDAEELINDQKLYILQALNLQDAYALLQSGVIENLRFSGDISRINLDESGIRIYAEDEGNAFTKLLYMLYPSNSGSLNLNDGGNRISFSKYGGIDPKTMAKFCVFLNDYRNGNISSIDIPDSVSGVTFFKNGKNKSWYFINNKENRLLKRYGLINKDLNVDFVLREEDLPLDSDKLKLYTSFMMELKRSVDLENDEAEFYPKYLTEHILMSYVIETCENDSVQQFYNEIVKQLSFQNLMNQNNNQSEIEKKDKIQSEIERLDRLNEIINEVEIQDLSPYKVKTQQNGVAYQIEKTEDSERNVEIKKETFADCADIVVRHVVNLLTYCNQKNWSLVLPSNEKYFEVNEKLKKVVDAIKNKSKVESYDLKTRLQIFFLYQSGLFENENKGYRSTNGADDVTELVRTLWEYAIFGMNKEVLGQYKIEYIKENIELEPGYINMLKLMWNIASALGLGSDQTDKGKTKLSLAKEEIDELTKKNEYNQEIFRRALQSTFELFCLDKNLMIDFDQVDHECEVEKFNSRNEITGEIIININGDNHKLDFKISQEMQHAYVEHTSTVFNFYSFKSFVEAKNQKIEKYTEDEYANLLLRNLTEKSCKIPALKSFLGSFSEEDLEKNDPFKKTKSYKKYKALSAYKTLAAEENNVLRIRELITSDVMDGAKLITIRKKKEEKNLSDIFYESFLKPNEENLSLNSYQAQVEYEDKKYGKKIFLEPNQKNELFMFSCINIGKNEARLLIKKIEGEKSLKIPSTVYDEKGQKLKVTSIARLSGLFDNLETVQFDNDFDELKIMPCTFYDAINLNNVVLRNKIKTLTVGNFAFCGCFYLNFFMVPKNILSLSIGEYAFSGCKNIKDFKIQKDSQLTNLTIGAKSFSGCENLLRFNIPANVNLTRLAIGEYAFFLCPYLQEFIIPQCVENLTIEECAFRQCINLKKFTTSQSITSLNIGACAFIGCSNLVSFTVPINVDRLIIGEYAFSDCEKLKNFEILKNNKLKDLQVGYLAFSSCSSLEKFEIPQNVVTLKVYEDAFYECSNLKIIMPIKLREKIDQELMDSAKIEFYNESVFKK